MSGLWDEDGDCGSIKRCLRCIKWWWIRVIMVGCCGFVVNLINDV